MLRKKFKIFEGLFDRDKFNSHFTTLIAKKKRIYETHFDTVMLKYRDHAFLQGLEKILLDYTASQPRKYYSSNLEQIKLQEYLLLTKVSFRKICLTSTKINRPYIKIKVHESTMFSSPDTT